MCYRNASQNIGHEIEEANCEDDTVRAVHT